MKNRIAAILSAAVLALAAAACSAKSEFHADLINEDQGVKATAVNASKGSSATTSLEIKEGEKMVVTSALTKGAISFTASSGASEMPSVDWKFDGSGTTEYQMEPGSYTLTFTAADNGTEGTLTVTKEQDDSLEAVSADDGQNPIMNFIGTYASGRCAILVEADGMEKSKFTVTWGSSAWQSSEWTMSGVLDTDTLTVNYTDGVRKDLEFKEDGTIGKETVVYENGTGSFKIEGSKLIWTDDNEHAADDLVFEYAN